MWRRLMNPHPGVGFALLLLAIAGALAYLWSACLLQTDGHFTYALDDPYIHMAIAKNLAFHGVWGVTEYANASASSSPLWILLLTAVVRVGGDSIYWPALFGGICSVAAALLIYSKLIRAGFLTLFALVGALAVFGVGPLHLLPFTGMEHGLQILLDLLFGFWLVDVIGRPLDSKQFWPGVLLSGLMCLCRFESVFLLVFPFFVFVWRRDWRLVGALVLGPALGIGGFGLCSHLAGMPWVPNSILLKGNLPKPNQESYIVSLLIRIYMRLRGGTVILSDLFLLTVFAGIGLRLRGLREATEGLQVWLWTVVAACILHAGFALVGIFYRYEAYLVVSLATILVLSLRELIGYSWPKQEEPVSQWLWVGAIVAVTGAQIVLSAVFWAYQLSANLVVSIYTVGLILLVSTAYGKLTRGRLVNLLMCTWAPLAFYFVVRSQTVAAFVEAPKGSRDIYLQQYQMSRFVARYYPTGRLGANDIGAVSYFTHVHLFDLVGLANDDVRRLKLAHNYTTKTMGGLLATFKPDLIIAYPVWFQATESIPKSMIPVADWIIPTVTTAAWPLVQFYAASPAQAARLRRQLMEFQSELPPAVKVTFVDLRTGKAEPLLRR